MLANQSLKGVAPVSRGVAHRDQWRVYARRLASVAGCCVVLGACDSSHPAGDSGAARQRAALESYLHRIEPLRLAVNRLLDGADPILDAFAHRRISHFTAARRMAALEQRFADDAVAVATIRPAPRDLRALHADYAHTYVLEDAYLNALVVGLREGDPEHLPSTENRQRAAIIQWRLGLTVLARRLAVQLPTDLQQAGRGEIVPVPDGS